MAQSQPSLVDVAEITRELDTSEQGLTSAEAAARLEKYGPNELASKPPVPTWRKILAQFQDPLVYLLLVAMVISVVAWFFEGAHGVPVDAIVIAIIVVANAVIGFAQESRAEGAVEALARMTEATSTVVRDGQTRSVPSAELVPGDVLVLGEGDAVGADARLLSAASLRMQEASLTGESEATAKDPATLDQEVPLGDRTNMVFKGTAVVQGVGRAVVTGTGMDTEMGAIAHMLDSTDADSSPLEKEIARVSKVLGILVIVIAVVVMGALFIINDVSSVDDAVEILLLGVSLAVAAVPEGLPAILSLVLAIGVQAMAKRQAIMKNLHDVETLGSASVIASDKTGTLTRNEMTLRRVVTADGVVELTGTGYAPEGQVDGDVDETTLEAARAALGSGVLANNASLREDDGWQIEGDPTEGAFIVAQHKLQGVPDRVSGFDRHAEAPFTSERKMMSVAGYIPFRDGEYLYAKGAPDVLLERCDHELVGGQPQPLSDERRQEILGAVAQASDEGFRTLGVAMRPIEGQPSQLDDSDEAGMTFAGFVCIIDPPRDEARQAIAEAHQAGIRTMMITGDHPRTAAKIGADLGIVEPGAKSLTGTELDKLSDDEFAQAVRDVNVYARVSPAHKLKIVDSLQNDGKIVAMTGDGVNDAPALKSADIGVAMGITGTEVTKEAANMILADDNYATIVDAVRQGRGIFDNIRKFLRFLLSSNMGEVVTIFFGVVLAGVMGLTGQTEGMVVPLLATQILWINLVTDSAPALAMGVDPETENLMTRKPRDPKEPIIDRHMWGRILFIGLIMGAVTLITLDMFLAGGLLTLSEHSVDGARTAAFTTLVFAQLFNALNSRADEISAFHGLFDNKWLWGAIGLTVVLQIAVVHVPFLQAAFSTEAMTAQMWAVSVGMAAIVLVAEELVKLVRRGSHR